MKPEERSSLRNPASRWREIVAGMTFVGSGCIAALLIDLTPQPVIEVAMIVCGAATGFLIGALIERN